MTHFGICWNYSPIGNIVAILLKQEMKREKSLKKVKIFEKWGEKSSAPQKKRPPSVEPLRSSRPQAEKWDDLGGGKLDTRGRAKPAPAELSQIKNDGKTFAEDDER